MSAIIDELRRMTAVAEDQYTVGTESYWSDDHLQAALDKRVTMRLLQESVDIITIVEVGGAVVAKHAKVDIVGTLDTNSAGFVGLNGEPIAGHRGGLPERRCRVQRSPKAAPTGRARRKARSRPVPPTR
jgi:hypothetical protein